MSTTSRALRGTAGRATSRAAALALLLTPLVPVVVVAIVVATLAATSRSGARTRVAAEDVAASAQTIHRTPTRSAGVGVFGTLLAAPGRMLAGAAAVGIAVILAVTGAAGSFAYYNTQTSVGSYTMSSGSLALTVQYGSGAAGSTAALPASFQNMLPGDMVGVPVTIASTGTAASTVTARLAAAAPAGWEVRIAPGACPATQLTTTALTTAALAYGTFPAGVATGACVQVLLRSDAAAGVASLGNFDIVIDATQVQS